MTQQTETFPNILELGGADTFLLILDRMMRRSGSGGNVCRLALWLEKPLKEEVFHRLICQDAFSRWICGLRLQKGFPPLRLPKWVYQEDRGVLPVISHHAISFEEAPPAESLNIDLDPEKDCPVRFDIFHSLSGDESLLVFHWHHALMDSHGAELYLQSLNENSTVSYLKKTSGINKTWKERLDALRQVKGTIFECGKSGFFGPHPKQCNLHCVSVLRFSAEETVRIDSSATAAGAGLQKSAYYLSATASALMKSMKVFGEGEVDFLTSLPQDQRRRGVQGPVLPNQLAFLFLRINGAALNDRSASVREVSKQMMDLMRSDFPQTYSDMMCLMRYLPPLLYQHLVRGPTKGRMASCCYSDTGTSLSAVQSFCECPVRHALHIPPNLSPPGLTVVSSRLGDRLNLTIVNASTALAPEELSEFMDHLRGEFLNEG